jgi:threonine/homoserine/homoserine lactone efflux protein
VGGGEHDWNTLFYQWGLIMQDRKIGTATRALGWLGMLATMVWLGWRTWFAWNANRDHRHRHYLT